MKSDVFVIYFPSWHPDRHYEQWHGRGFSEWTEGMAFLPDEQHQDGFLLAVR